MSEWYALHVKARFEKYVTNQLSIKGYETFLPTYAAKRKWSDRTKAVSLPLFPTYVFCRFDLHSRLPIVMTPGVMAIVGPGKLPTPLDESEFASIRLVTNAASTTQPCPYLAVGERVRVQAGPLKGLVAIVDRTQGNRLVVSISLLMRSVSVEVDRNSVGPLEQELSQDLELVPMR